MNTKSTRQRLLGSSGLMVAAAVMIAAPLGVAALPTGALAQTTDAPAAANAPQEIVVTGSILRRKLSDTADPVTTITAADLQDRGITTITNAIQSIAANGSSSLPNSFSANGAFAAGAAAVSLRGLTTNSTLVLVDGLRMTYYPLADDGTRNFVDLNTIPDIIIDRIQTLKDGASSTYGADAIAGVVNVITKKTYEGVTAKAEGGLSEHGGGAEENFQALVGHGNLAVDGYNVYVGVEYEHDEALFNRQRGYPFNTADVSRTCGASLIDGTKTCRTNGVVNGVQFDGSFQGVGSTTVPVVRPYFGNTALGDFQLLNPAAGCGNLTPVTITPSQAAAGGAVGVTAPVNLCQQDLVRQYGTISPDDKRFSISLRGTKKLWGDAEGYFTANYYQNDVFSRAVPSSIRQQSTPGSLGLVYSTANTPGLVLPVYVCASGVNCGPANGTLNPNNPFAAIGETASIRYRFGDIPASNEQFSQTYRLAAGLSGSFNFMGPWQYNVDLTGSQTDLQNTANGDIYIANLLNAVATGAYNFVNPAQNTAAVRNFIAPQNIQISRSQLGMIQGSLRKDLFQLPGGELQLGLTGAARYESIDNPSANPDNNGATNRYFTINPFGTIGSRSTQSVAFELDAPVLKQIDIDVSGRYDTYSTGQSHFSPKIGGIIKPFADWAPQFNIISLRSTYSDGFRIPSFAESNSLPTTGFVTQTAPKSFQAAHNNDGYGVGYSLGETTVGTGGLKPETSKNFTAGIVLEPDRHLSFSVDYYRIVKKQVIVPNNTNLGAALAAYFAGTPIPAGYSIIPGIPDPNAPNAQILPGFIQYGFINQDEESTSGYDFGATARYNLPYGFRFTSAFDANYVLRLDVTTPTGRQHYAGTIGPYNNVSAAGTPKLRANWSNTLERGPLALTVTAYYTDGYQLQAEDFGDTTGVCIAGGASASNVNTTYLDGVTPVQCKVKPFWDIDTHVSYQVNRRLQLYLDVTNLFDKNPPIDPTTYGAVNYNDVIANSGIYGRYFKFGVRATF